MSECKIHVVQIGWQWKERKGISSDVIIKEIDIKKREVSINYSYLQTDAGQVTNNKRNYPKATFLKAIGVYFMAAFILYWCVPGGITMFQSIEFDNILYASMFCLPLIGGLVTWNLPVWRFNPRLMYVAFLGINILAFSLVAVTEEYWMIHQIRNNGFETEGYVSSLKFKDSDRDTSAGVWVIYQFELEEETFYTNKYHAGYSKVGWGDTVTILYLPNRPERCIPIESHL